MKLNNKKTAIIIAFLIIGVLVVTGTFAKYVYNSVWSYYLTSKGFYFESDLLSLNDKKNAILDWNGEDITFLLKNNDGTFVTEFDITYKISCEVLGDESSYAVCDLNNTGKAEYEGVLTSTSKCVNRKDETDVSKFTKADCEVNGYSWSNDLITKENVFNISSTDATKSIDEVSVKITVESVLPYKKVLSGIFNLNIKEELESSYETYYSSYGEYDEITLINKTNTNKCYLIGFDSEKHLLNTEKIDNNIIEIYYDEDNKTNGLETEISGGNSAIYYFYRISSKDDYSIDDFIITEKEC